MSESSGSLFKVPLTKVLEVKNHPNADRLSICTVYGFEIVTGKDQYQVGDQVYFVPIDSVIPMWLEEIVFQNSKIKPHKGRIKQIKIRQFPSQGLLINPKLIHDTNHSIKLEEDYAEYLGVVKYEPPVPEFQQPRTKKERKRPLENSKFRKFNGITNIKWDPNSFEGEDVVIQCKLHGSHIRWAKAPFEANTLWKKIIKFLGLAPKFEFCIGSNNVELTNRKSYTGFYGEDVYSAAAKKLDVMNKTKDGEFWHAELIGPGIQKGYTYGHTEHHIVVFDVRVLQPDGTQKWLNPEEAEALAKERGLDFVPVLYKGPYSKEVVAEHTSGPSVYCPAEKIREGCVVKSRFNYDHNENKRALKSINPDYLNTDPSDNH